MHPCSVPRPSRVWRRHVFSRFRSPGYTDAVNELPRLTTDPERCKADLERSGYCLLADALPPAELQEAQERLTAQAAAERKRGVAYMDGAPAQRWGAFADAAGEVRQERFTMSAGGVSQRLFMLLNKGRIFRDIVLMEHALELVEKGAGRRLPALLQHRQHHRQGCRAHGVAHRLLVDAAAGAQGTVRAARGIDQPR